jgi:hypothetical protein
MDRFGVWEDPSAPGAAPYVEFDCAYLDGRRGAADFRTEVSVRASSGRVG